MMKVAFLLFKRERKNIIGLCISVSATITSCLIFMQLIKSPYLFETASIFDVSYLLNGLLICCNVIVCVILTVYSHHYYLKNRSREYGLIKLFGVRSLKISLYNLMPILLVTLISMIIGILLFLVINPMVLLVVYHIMDMDLSIFYINKDAFIQGLAIVIAIIIVLYPLNMGYIYKTDIMTLLDDRNIIDYRKDKRILRLPAVIYLFIYVLGLFLMYTGENEIMAYIVFAIIGAFGAQGMFHKFFPKILKKNFVKKKKINCLIDSDVGLLMQQSKTLIIIVIVSTIIFIPFIIGTVEQKAFHFELHLSFIIINILLSLTLVSRFKIDEDQRKNHFFSIYKLGFAKEDIIKIYRKETIKYYLAMWGLIGLYLINTLIVFINRQGLEIKYVGIVLLELLPYVVSEIYILWMQRRMMDNEQQYC